MTMDEREAKARAVQGYLHAQCRDEISRRDARIEALETQIRQLEADLMAPADWRKKLPTTLAEWEELRRALRETAEALDFAAGCNEQGSNMHEAEWRTLAKKALALAGKDSDAQ